MVSPLQITIGAKSPLPAVGSWNLDMLTPEGKRFRAFSGKWPTPAILWDGKSTTGLFVTPLPSYSLVLTLRDDVGLEGKSTASVSVADLPKAVEQSGIQARRAGFSSTSVSAKHSLDILLRFGNRGSVKSWAVAIASPTAGLEPEIMGSGSTIPEYVVRDSKDETGKLVAEGNCYASLAVDYGVTRKHNIGCSIMILARRYGSESWAQANVCCRVSKLRRPRLHRILEPFPPMAMAFGTSRPSGSCLTAGRRTSPTFPSSPFPGQAPLASSRASRSCST